MTAQTAPISTTQTNNRTKNHNLGRWALAAVGLAAAAGMTVAIVGIAGNGATDTDPVNPAPAITESNINGAEPSSYVPGAEGARVQAGRPDGGFQAPAVNLPGPSGQSDTGARLESGRPDGTWSAPVAQADCQTNRFC